VLKLCKDNLKLVKCVRIDPLCCVFAQRAAAGVVG
jgi:hypothetical protein